MDNFRSCDNKLECLDPVLLQLATQMLDGDADEACRWLQTPIDAFSGTSPLAHAMTEKGREEVIDYIGQARFVNPDK